VSDLRCLAGPACRAADTVGDERLGAVTATASTLCEPCEKHFTGCVAKLPTDWEELRAALGERSPAKNAAVRSTPTPAIPVSVAKEALMSEIVEMADIAATVVSGLLNTDRPTGRRNTAPTFAVGAEEVRVKPGTPAAHAEARARAAALQQLRACVAMVEPNLTALAAAPTEAVQRWDKQGEGTEDPIEYGDDGQPVKGRGRVFTEMTGIDIILALKEVHDRTRAELGKTRLRHKMGSCPRCGHPVGRDDGTTIIDCRNDNCTPQGRSAWPEREFHYLQGLILDEHKRNAKGWLLDESYQRLDKLQELVDSMAGDERIDLPGAGAIILERITKILTDGVKDADGKPIGHQRPRDRAIATDLASAKAREVEDWQWSWTNEAPYRPPKRKPRKPKPEPKHRYASSSLSLLVDIDEDAVENATLKCDDCNLVHTGACA
jgi:hypothetical protein